MNTRTESQPTPTATTVAGYLLTRLAEAGVASVFGVPGDYNLGLLDAVAARPQLAWIGMATEQGAGYAADSYARLRGLGAVVTTFGAGELSALNAIAGACAESVPIVHIVGTPALAARTPGATFHHMLPGGGFDDFARMAAEVTAAQADLRPEDAPAEIDRVLSTALCTSRPVYLTIPADVAGAPVPAPVGRLPQAGRERHADPAVLTAFAGHSRRSRADLTPEAAQAGDATAPVPDGPLTQRSLWTSVQEFLRPGDLLIADQGTAFYGAAELTMPDGAQLAGQPLWASLGWSVPATLGASLAAPDRRVILIAGDSAMQQTAPELGTLLSQGLVPVVIVLDNGGCTTERVIGHPDAEYHDVPAWDWTALPTAVGPARGTVTLRVRTRDELAWALVAASYHAGAGRPVLIEAVLGADDTPPMLRALTHR